MKKKVLHLLASNKYSGAENVACTIIEGTKNNVEGIYCSPNGQIKKSLNAKNIKYLPLKKLSYGEVKKAIKKYNPDIIHAHDYKASCLAALFYNKKYKIISHIHNNNNKMRERNFYSFLFKVLSKRFEKIIWVSDSALDCYFYKNNVIGKSIVLYNIINQEYVIEKSKLYCCNDDFDLVFIGRLSEQKNPERLIEICTLLKRDNSAFRLALIGDGEKREKIKNMIHARGLDDNIFMYGYIDNPYPILAKSKILIMTSDWEGTPMVALEAQALGKPIISTPVDGMKQIIVNKYNGYLLKDNNKIVDVILRLLTDEAYSVVAKNVNARFKIVNDEQKYYSEIIKVYNN